MYRSSVEQRVNVGFFRKDITEDSCGMHLEEKKMFLFLRKENEIFFLFSIFFCLWEMDGVPPVIITV